MSHTTFWKMSQILNYRIPMGGGGCPFMFQDLKKAQKSPMSTVLLHKAHGWYQTLRVCHMQCRFEACIWQVLVHVTVFTPPLISHERHPRDVERHTEHLSSWVSSVWHPGFPKMQSVQVAFLSAPPTPHLTTYGTRRTWSEVGFLNSTQSVSVAVVCRLRLAALDVCIAVVSRCGGVWRPEGATEARDIVLMARRWVVSVLASRASRNLYVYSFAFFFIFYFLTFISPLIVLQLPGWQKEILKTDTSVRLRRGKKQMRGKGMGSLVL